MDIQLAALWVNTPGDYFVISLFVTLFGVLMFFFGFRTYRQYRLLEDTPLFPVRSVPMGLVHVQGKCTGGQPLTSPITQVPCYYYHVQIEEERDKGGDDNRTEWVTVGTDKAEVPFYLQDDTGWIQVNPQQAESDVTRTFYGEVRPKTLLSIGHATRKIDETLGVPMPSEDYLLAYLHGQTPAQAAKLAAAQAQLQASGHNVAAKALGFFAGLQGAGAQVAVGGGGVNLSFGIKNNHRITEHCLVAERNCNVLGTCTENPNPANEYDHNLIKKGENEKTYLITDKTEKQAEKGLRRKALLLIVLGGAFLIGAAALMLHAAHLL